LLIADHDYNDEDEEGDDEVERNQIKFKKKISNGYIDFILDRELN
jgi:hypothetical protein